MSVRIIEIVTTAGQIDTLNAIAEKFGALDFRSGFASADGSLVIRILAHPERQQELLDQVQASLGASKPGRIVILPVDAAIPEPKLSEAAQLSPQAAIREELYVQTERGAHLDNTFLLLTTISTIVAVIGLLENSMTIVIAAMLIAPLLGPNVALAFASALGDRALIAKSLTASGAGLALAIGGAAVIGILVPNGITSAELLSRTVIGYDSVVVALASGAAGALSLMTRLSSALVGVLVAVALLPPAATLGYMLGTGDMEHALGAGALLLLNVVCVNLSAQLVFLVNGIKPRTWLERRSAQQSVKISLFVWFSLLALLIGVIALQRS